MGLLDTILEPFKAITSGLIKSVNFAEKIFGEVVDLVKETIDLIENMITEIENLFNASKVEKIFLYPFKEAALVAVGSVHAIFDLLKDIAPTADGYKDFIVEPIDNVYKIMRSSVSKLKDEGKNIINEIEKTNYKLISTVENKFESFAIILAGFPDDLLDIGEKIKREFEVKGEKLFEIVPEFTGYVKKDLFETEKKVTSNINTDVQSFKNVEQSIKTKFANENSSVDLIFVAIILVLVIVMVGIYYITKSIFVIAIIFIVFIVALILYTFNSLFSKIL